MALSSSSSSSSSYSPSLSDWLPSDFASDSDSIEALARQSPPPPLPSASSSSQPRPPVPPQAVAGPVPAEARAAEVGGGGVGPSARTANESVALRGGVSGSERPGSPRSSIWHALEENVLPHGAGSGDGGIRERRPSVATPSGTNYLNTSNSVGVPIPPPLPPPPSADDTLKASLRFYLGSEPALDNRYFLDDVNMDKDEGMKREYGIIGGAVLPTLQGLVGPVLFLRMPWVTGQAGWGLMLCITAMSVFVSLLTTMSMNAIMTNGRFTGGGVYVMLSRSLGPGFGGAVGVILVVANVSSTGTGLIAVADTIVSLGLTTGIPELDSRLFSSLVGLLLGVFLYFYFLRITKIVTYLHGLVLLIVIFPLVGIFAAPLKSQAPGVTGIRTSTLMANFGPDFDEGVNFTLCFAIFFPAITGVLTGSQFSAAVRNPQRNLPIGVLFGTLVAAGMYFIVPVLICAVSERDVLTEDYFFVARIQWPSPVLGKVLILVMSITKCLHRLGSASRTLNRLVLDDIFPQLSFLKRGQEKRTAGVVPISVIVVVITLGVIASAVAATINVLSPVSAMANLLMYSLINFTCVLNEYLMPPGWRPAWKYHHWLVSLLGVISSVTIMFVINWIAALVCLGVAAALFGYVSFLRVSKNWGDGLSGARFSLASYLLNSASTLPANSKNWRPLFLILSRKDEANRLGNKNLFRLAQFLNKGVGLVISGSVIVGSADDPQVLQEAKAIRSNAQALFTHMKIDAFVNTVVDAHKVNGVSKLIQLSGLGALTPNTVVMEWPRCTPLEDPAAEFLTGAVKAAMVFGKAFLLVKGELPVVSPVKLVGEVHLWWLFHDGGLLVLLPALLLRHRMWSDCRLVVFAVALKTDNVVALKRDLLEFLAQLRIEARVEVISLEAEEISLYTYQRTLKQKERLMFERELYQRMSKKAAPTLDSTVSAKTFVPRSGSSQSIADGDEKARATSSWKRESLYVSRNDVDTACTMNSLMKLHSWNAQLIVSNLPSPLDAESDKLYGAAIEALLIDLHRVILVRGSGQEVVTVYG